MISVVTTGKETGEQMKILVTGFDPFGGEHVNPAYEAVRNLPEMIPGAEVIKLEIPTAFRRSAAVLEQAIEAHQPDVVLCVGQAGGRAQMSVEKVAINLAEARIPDNDEDQPVDEPLREDGDTAYFATLPVKAMAAHMRQHGIPAGISYTAGTYVCNSIMYHVLYLAQTRFNGLRAGFIHVPFATSQVIGKPASTPSMALSDITRGLELAIEAIIGHSEDISDNMGATH